MNRHYAMNEVIFRQGDAAGCMYEIVAGRVGIFANYGEDDQKLLTMLCAGKTFGEMSMIEGLPRSATAVAVGGEAELRDIQADDFEKYLREKPEEAFEVVKQMSARIRGLTQDYLDACKTIAEMSEASETKTDKDAGLLGRIEKYINEYANRQAAAFGGSLEVSGQIWS